MRADCELTGIKTRRTLNHEANAMALSDCMTVGSFLMGCSATNNSVCGRELRQYGRSVEGRPPSLRQKEAIATHQSLAQWRHLEARLARSLPRTPRRPCRRVRAATRSRRDDLVRHCDAPRGFALLCVPLLLVLSCGRARLRRREVAVSRARRRTASPSCLHPVWRDGAASIHALVVLAWRLGMQCRHLTVLRLLRRVGSERLLTSMRGNL